MGILGEYGERTAVQPNPQEQQRNTENTLNQMYGYQEDEEKKNQMLYQFLQYLKESKERDRAKLQQSRII